MAAILVTGATGFIGRNVVQALLSRGYEVTATSANADRASNEEWYPQVNYRELNFDNLTEGVNYFEYFDNPEKVIHLAWEGLPNYKSLFHFEVNLPRHYFFLKNLIQNGCRDVTVTGTCFEYGMKEGMLSENLPTAPANPYGLAKDCLNKFLNQLGKEEPFSLKWTRLFYLYGKGQNAGSLFSQLQRSLDNNEASFNMSGGEQVRDYLPVEEAADYIVKIALQHEIEGVINCCSGKPVTVKEMVERHIAASGKKIKLNLGYYPYPDYEAMAFWGDSKKLQKIIDEK